jgi:hypothetical protein
MPLQNRVSPFGDLFASPARGTMFGNRGGKFHRDDRTLGLKRFASRQWICCLLRFKNRQRDVWGRYYTELFFLDEVTALAAGHRPCFECRREDAAAFAGAFAKGQGALSPPRAGEMDRILHAERLDGTSKRTHRRSIDDLPDGTFIALPRASVVFESGAASEPSPREAAGRVARDPSTGISAERKARGVGGGSIESSSRENLPPPLTPQKGVHARLRRAMHFAVLNGGRGTQAAHSPNTTASENLFEAFVIRGDKLLRWMPAGYDQSIPRPRGLTVDVLTPPSIIAALAAGYRPGWHSSAALVSAAAGATTPR